MNELIPTKSDRELASKLYDILKPNNGLVSTNIELGNLDDGHLVQAIAQYRIDCMKEGMIILKDIDPPESMWNGLARKIMMWLDFDNRTWSSLFHHLKHTLDLTPQWIKDEQRAERLDKIPSKGTRVVLIYKAMLQDLDPDEILNIYHDTKE